jgi:hypothetical protein
MNATHKLYRDGRVFDLRADPFEEHAPRQADDLSGTDADAIQKLETALKQFSKARPAHLLASTPGKAKKTGAEKAARKQRKEARQRKP